MKLQSENAANLFTLIVILLVVCHGCKPETTTPITKEQASDVVDDTVLKPLDEKLAAKSSEVVKPLQPLPPADMEVIHTDLPVSEGSELPQRKHARAPGEIVPAVMDYLPTRPPQLPDEIVSRLADLRRKMMYSGIPNYSKSDEYAEKQLEILTGDLSDEEAVAFLEKYKYYNTAILTRISAGRGFTYLARIGSSPERIHAAAMQAVAENPNNYDAYMYLLSDAKRESRILGYREILDENPTYVPALQGLARDIAYESPLQAAQHLKKSIRLDPSYGFFDLGITYERMGDYKTAWLCYRRELTLPHFHGVETHIFNLESGVSNYPLVEETIGSRPENMDSSFVEDTVSTPKFYPVEAHQELKKFQVWVESIVKEKSETHTDNLLAKEIDTFIKYGRFTYDPDRTVQAYEFIARHGDIIGLRHLKKQDLQLALEIERISAKKRIQ